MPLLVRDLVLQLDEPLDAVCQKAARRLGVDREEIRAHAIVRRSLDARRKDGIAFRCNVELALTGGPKREEAILRGISHGGVEPIRAVPPMSLQPGSQPMRHRPIVVGFGPAGMMAGLMLARQGYRPIVLERGRDVRRRHRDILQRFYRDRQFDPESNLLFGEGGAGAYSDGKLYTRVNDPRVRTMLEIFFQHGASPDILIDGRPHIGSDRLPTLCRRIRESIEAAGGEIRFDARLEQVSIDAGRLTGVNVRGETLPAETLILAIGHSARDTIRMLAAAGVRLEAKPFQLGVRIEHPQALVDRWQYGGLCGNVRLPPADYHVVARGAGEQRGDVFSFCMCPGGLILPTAESPGLIATNGASNAARSGPFANSGLVMTVDPVEVGGDALAGLAFLEHWERTAWEQTGGTYAVPAQRARDLLRGRGSDGRLETSYPFGGRWVEMQRIVPDFVAASVARAIRRLDSQMPGFGGDEALVTGPESRVSAPLRIVRDSQTRESVNVVGLYPTGEGAGYAGGIISAGVDGMYVAESIIRRYAPYK